MELANAWSEKPGGINMNDKCCQKEKNQSRHKIGMGLDLIHVKELDLQKMELMEDKVDFTLHLI